MSQNYGENTSTSLKLLLWMYVTGYLVNRCPIKIGYNNKGLGSQENSKGCTDW